MNSFLPKLIFGLPTGVSTQITKYYFKFITRNQTCAHSTIEHHNYRKMDVKVLPALQDNYMYLIIDKETKDAAIVDPVDPQSVLEAVNAQGVNLKAILTTHHHWDHAGGNANLVKLHPGLVVYGGDSRIDALTNKVSHNDTFNIGTLKVECLFTPCHTTGHICYYVTSDNDDKVVFTGDTLFIGGCGRFFEGTAEQMYNALIKILSALPNETLVFCGHEYSLQNLKFAKHVEPQNVEVLQKIAWSTQRREEGKPTIPSTILEEKLYNPFMRVMTHAVQKYVNKNDPIEVMKVLRCEKDGFQ